MVGKDLPHRMRYRIASWISEESSALFSIPSIRMIYLEASPQNVWHLSTRLAAAWTSQIVLLLLLKPKAPKNDNPFFGASMV